MKAKDLLQILEHNDPGVSNRVAAVRTKLKASQSFNKCNDCGSDLSFNYTILSGVGVVPCIVEASTCGSCLSKRTPKTHVIH